MEATAAHNFDGTNVDELSFKKGSKLKILSMEEDKNWFKAEFNGKEGYVPSNYIELKPYSWYLSKIGREDAKALLLERGPNGAYVQKDGAFLVRSSESTPGQFSLSVKYNNDVQHFRVIQDMGSRKYYLWDNSPKFDSLNSLIQYHRTSSVSQNSNILLQDMTRQKVIANYDFKPDDTEELELKRGDIVTVIDKRDENWWTGEVVRDNRTVRGIFPRTYTTPY